MTTEERIIRDATKRPSDDRIKAAREWLTNDNVRANYEKRHNVSTIDNPNNPNGKIAKEMKEEGYDNYTDFRAKKEADASRMTKKEEADKFAELNKKIERSNSPMGKLMSAIRSRRNDDAE